MRLGDKGDKWLSGLNETYTDASSLCSTWQQEFFENYVAKAADYGAEGYITEKQLKQLNKIADIYGYPQIDEGDLDVSEG